LVPAVLIPQDPLSPSTEISMEILRGGKREFTGATLLSRMKRDAAVLVQYLYRNNYLPQRMFFCSPAPELCHLIRSTLRSGDEKFELRSPPSNPGQCCRLIVACDFAKTRLEGPRWKTTEKEFICPFRHRILSVIDSFQAGTVINFRSVL